MGKMYAWTMGCVLLLLALSFVVPAIKSLRRLQSGGVSKDTVNAVAVHLIAAMVASAIMVTVCTVYFVQGLVPSIVYYVLLSGLVAILLGLLGVTSLFVDEGRRR
jgi:hypothetical protein